jgi:hypothetical protein
MNILEIKKEIIAVSFGVYFDNDRTYRHRIFLFVHFYLRWALSNLYHLIYKFYF